MANTIRHRGGDEQYVTDLEVASATVIEIGDLICEQTKKAVPASSITGSSAALRQAAAAAIFSGLSRSSSANGETDNVDVDTGGLAEMAITSGTYKSGELVTFADSGSALLDQQVVVTTDPTLAIGCVWKNYTAATTKVFCRLWSRTHGPAVFQS